MRIDAAILYVKNLAESITFFHEKLGFTLEFQDGDRYASFIFEGDARLGIIQANAKEIENPGHNALKIRVTNAAAIYKELQEKGMEFYKPLTVEPWATEFIVLDVDKNKIIMVERE
jgi:predicted enzyme related to lactoylglutathione lyase